MSRTTGSALRGRGLGRALRLFPADMSRRVVLPTAAVLALVAAPGTWLWLQRESGPTSPPVAHVNGVSITERDVAVRLSELLPMTSFHGRIAPEKLLALRRTALDELVLEELILREALDGGLRPTRRAVDLEVEHVRQRFGSDEAFDQALASNGLTRLTFRRHMERAVLLRQAKDAQLPPEPDDADALTYYRGNAGKFIRPEQVHLLEMLVAVDPAGGRSADRAAQAKVNALMGELKAGADFGTLAWNESQDAYRVKNGDLGWVHRGRLDPDLEAAVFAAPVGTLRVARSLSGFHLFKVLARQPDRQLSFEEARTSIVDRLRRERRDAADAAWHERLRRDARIDIVDAELARAEAAEIPQLNLTPGRQGSAVPVATPSH